MAAARSTSRWEHATRWVPGTLVVLVILVLAGGDAHAWSPRVDAAPFAGLSRCGDEPYVAVFAGVTEEGVQHSHNGDSPRNDIYGIRPDGSIARITTDLGDYRVGITADASTLVASPEPDQIGPNPDDTATPDGVVSIDAATGEQHWLVQVPSVGAVAPAPDGSPIAITTYARLDPPAFVTEGLTLFDTGAPTDLRVLPAIDSATRRSISRFTWAPDGRSIAYLTVTPRAEDVRVVAVETGSERVLHQEGEGGPNFFSLDWSPDGRHLLAVRNVVIGPGRFERQAVEIDVDTGALAIVLSGVSAELAYSATDGSRITGFVHRRDTDALLAQTWTRQVTGTFVLTSSTEIGLVGAAGLDIPACAMQPGSA